MKTYEVRTTVTVEYAITFNVTAESEQAARAVINEHALTEFDERLIDIDERHVPDCRDNARLGVEFLGGDVTGEKIEIDDVILP